MMQIAQVKAFFDSVSNTFSYVRKVLLHSALRRD